MYLLLPQNLIVDDDDDDDDGIHNTSARFVADGDECRFEDDD